MPPMDRPVKYLLRKYETKQPGEEWKPETEYKYLKDYRHKQRMFTLEKIVNERTSKSRGTFQLPKAQKDRARHLIRHLDFTGRTTEEQYIVMILIYVKLEANNNSRPIQYYPLLEEYQIPVTTFISFLITLNKYHATN